MGPRRTLWCWGSNEWGQLGDRTLERRLRPVAIAGPEGVVGVSLGLRSSCALDSQRRVWCWGVLAWPQVPPTAPEPRVLGTRARIASISLGLGHACLREDSGEVWCWGYNGSGELGLGRCLPGHFADFPGDQVPASESLQVPNLPPMEQISPSTLYNAGFASDDTLWTWGGGRCADPPPPAVARRPPEAIGARRRAHLPGVSGVSAGGGTLCARTLQGAVHCMGENLFGTLGDGATASRPEFGPVEGLEEVTALEGTLNSFCAVRRDGSLWCWGDNEFGQLGVGLEGHDACHAPSMRHVLNNLPVPCRRRPTRVLLPGPVRQVAVGVFHVCAVLFDESLWCWGRNEHGEVGDGSLQERWLPVEVSWSRS
ncbi:MAG: hypothetical protein HY909_10785 [Deltaproteobacteria bacterium]|nr:hypothetical protein [Deltaproteobacteria bacterium]